MIANEDRVSADIIEHVIINKARFCFIPCKCSNHVSKLALTNYNHLKKMHIASTPEITVLWQGTIFPGIFKSFFKLYI